MCVYISTDYVFDGDKGASYTEEDPPCPINVYGVSKLAGEHLVRQTCARWMIVRLASLFGGTGARSKGGNFVDTVIEKARSGARLNIVGDIRMTPVYAYDAARALEQLIRQRASGVFHIANLGSCTWYDFACRALELARISAQVQCISSSDYPFKARRPRDSSLASVKWQPAGDNVLRSWPEALRAYLEEKYHRSACYKGVGS
jgi:dTDP-4-dehydrorhamnose reductase